MNWYVHYDYGVSGVQDMLTSWIPLMEISVQIGGLAVQPGTPRHRALAARSRWSQKPSSALQKVLT